MRKLIQFLNISPDGFCGHEGAIADKELHEHANALLKRVDLVLFGRVTYELFVDYWPKVAVERNASDHEIEFADLIDAIPKLVFSTTLPQVDWRNSQLERELTAERILQLKQQPGKDISISGLSLMEQLSQMGLIDEYHFLIQPMVVGKGKRLFETRSLETLIPLELVDIMRMQSGVVHLVYSKK